MSPPGQALSDLDILVDFARRMGFADRSGRPVPRWDSPQDAFDAWRECLRGRPCDYSALTYAKLRDSAGIQWPCTDQAPGGTERLYTGHRFPTGDDCETYGHDLGTGAAVTAAEHRISDGDLVRVESVRGHVDVRARCTGTRPGAVLLPFHYGDVDQTNDRDESRDARRRSANELTATAWDPVSKQPTFTSGAVRIRTPPVDERER